jgi:hypothetical protein
MLRLVILTVATDITRRPLVNYLCGCLRQYIPFFFPTQQFISQPQAGFCFQKPNFKKKCTLCYYAIMRSLEMSNMN